MKISNYLIIMFFVVFMIVGMCGVIGAEAYPDGVYEGAHSFVKVRVHVSEGKIIDIEIMQHGGGGKMYEDMIAPLKMRIIESQSLDVDGITGATVSSEHFKKAVKNALPQE